MLEVLHNSCIDRNKWNSLVALAGDGALFGHSDFLDSIHENWCGVVFGNYEAAVPIFRGTVWVKIISFSLKQAGIMIFMETGKRYTTMIFSTFRAG